MAEAAPCIEKLLARLEAAEDVLIIWISREVQCQEAPAPEAWVLVDGVGLVALTSAEVSCDAPPFPFFFFFFELENLERLLQYP